jgi:hypothetical protein
MGGMFYSLQEVIEKLNKTEQDVRELVKMGRLREFRDGQSLLFKIDEVEALLLDTTVMAALSSKKDDTKTKGGKKKPKGADEAEILLVPEKEPSKSDKGSETDADTVMAGEGINVLEETDSEYKFAGDTEGETKALTEEASLEEIEKDVSLDSFGSGSGLLDLSLQADDTSLGGILDEIYTPEGAGGKQAGVEESAVTGEGTKAGGSGQAAGVVEEAEQIVPEEQFVPSQLETAAEAVTAAQVYVEPEPDASSNLYGIMLLLVLAAVVYAIVVVMTGSNGVIPPMLASIQNLVWYIMGGASAAVVLIFGMSFVVGGGGKVRAEKKPKVKKEKKAKEAKKEAAKKEEAAKEETVGGPEAEGQS